MGGDCPGKVVNTMKMAALFLAALLLAGCSCLAAQGYDQSGCEKYHTNWAASTGYFNE
jgi:outer membrane murein-binding lipoprotein Lpp